MAEKANGTLDELDEGDTAAMKEAHTLAEQRPESSSWLLLFGELH